MARKKGESKQQEVTATDVAKVAGVSPITVSRVFNRNWKGSLRPETEQKVREVAAKMGYTPNAIAQILTNKKSGIVAIITSHEYDLFYAEVSTLLINELKENNFKSMFFTCKKDENINDCITEVTSYQVDAIIVLPSAMYTMINEEKISNKIPVILYNGFSGQTQLDIVSSDNYAGCILMADYLVALGHKSFAYFSTERSYYGNYEIRERAFRDGLARHGIQQCTVLPSDYIYENAYEIANDFFMHNDCPDAIFCSSDFNALAAVDAAREHGIRVGKDVSITGFHADQITSLRAYDLTALVQDTVQLCKDAVKILCERLDNPEIPPMRIFRPMSLHVGNTTIPPKK